MYYITLGYYAYLINYLIEDRFGMISGNKVAIKNKTSDHNIGRSQVIYHTANGRKRI